MVDNSGDIAILPAMFGIKAVRFSGRNGVFRLAVSAALALWCVFALASGEARALCLDLGGKCSPSAAVPEGPCHDRAPDNGTNPSCDSCVDIIVHQETATCGNRPDPELRASAAPHPSGSGSHALLAREGMVTATAPSLIGGHSPHPFLRTAVLRI